MGYGMICSMSNDETAQSKPIRHALRELIKAHDSRFQATNAQIIAGKLIERAKQGDIQAIGMIADRLDGKPVAEVNATVTATVVDPALLATLASRLMRLGPGDTLPALPAPRAVEAPPAPRKRPTEALEPPPAPVTTINPIADRLSSGALADKPKHDPTKQRHTIFNPQPERH